MRVLQILPAMHVGGVETGTLDLARELVKRGHQAYVVSTGGSLVPELIKAGVHHITLPVKKKSLWSFRSVPAIRRLIQRESIDIVHARSRVPALIACLAVRGTRATFVTTCHGFYSDHAFSRVMGWGRRVIVTSNVIGRRMMDTFGVDPSRTAMVHRGVDLSRFTFDQKKYGAVNNGKFVIACVGRLSPIKGIEDLIKALSLLNRKMGNAELWIVGEEEKDKKPYTEKLRELTHRLGLESSVKFLGHRRDISEVLREVHLLVMPSRVPESFGRVLVEAGATGTAAIATRLGGALDIIEDGINGLLVPPADAVQLSEAMERVLRDRELAKRFGESLRAKVERVFSLEKMVDGTLRVYQEALEDQRILIVKIGALGDIVLATPSLRMVRKRYPSAHIALLADRKFYKIIGSCPYMNEIILVDRDKSWKTLAGFLQLSRRLKKSGFDISIDLQNTAKTHLLCALAGIRTRVGYRRIWTGRFLTHGAGRFRDVLPPIAHQFRVLQLVNIHDFDDTLNLWPSEEASASVETKLDSEWVNPSQRLAGFVLGASNRWATKQWPLSKFAELAGRLSAEMGVRVVLVGSATDRYLAEEFKKQSPVPVVDMVAHTDLDELTALIQKLDVLITGDSAPMHIAAAVKTPLIALFGPTNPKRHVPPGTGHTVMYKQVACSPCYRTTCQVGHICMKNITVEEVFRAVESRLRGPLSTGRFQYSSSPNVFTAKQSFRIGDLKPPSDSRFRGNDEFT
ncbi:MAG: lipopolysaccharide heptosyltransferase II [Candidatus Omnitrophica bacterium]|nr:lipopolysaccharide heptosyltransferase II [Candidatus Omnitrophota bacterium]